jgi:hypothetical protein
MIDPPKRRWYQFNLHVLLFGATIYFSAGNVGARFILAWTVGVALGMVAMHHSVSASIRFFIAAISRHPGFPRNPEMDQAINGFDFAVVARIRENQLSRQLSFRTPINCPPGGPGASVARHAGGLGGVSRSASRNTRAASSPFFCRFVRRACGSDELPLGSIHDPGL